MMSDYIRELSLRWDKISSLIDDDPMRPVRYGMGLRYLKNLSFKMKILDLGCGEGFGLKIIHRLGYKNLYGVDISKERIKKAQKNLPKEIVLSCIQEDGSIPQKEKYFDIVLCLAVIEHVSDQEFLLREISRVLKDEGYAVISSDCYSWRILQILTLYKSVQPIDKALSYFSLKELFKKTGFFVEHFDTFNLPERGNIYVDLIKNNSLSNILKKLIFKSSRLIDKANLHDKSSEDLARVCYKYASGSIDTAFSNRFIKILRNLIDDENIFLLKKTHQEKLLPKGSLFIK